MEKKRQDIDLSIAVGEYVWIEYMYVRAIVRKS